MERIINKKVTLEELKRLILCEYKSGQLSSMALQLYIKFKRNS